MKVAVICPDELSIVAFCSGIIRELKDQASAEIVIIAAPLAGHDRYSREIVSWGVRRIPLRMSRGLGPAADLAYLLSLWRTLRREKVDAVINISTKPNLYGTAAARLARVRHVFCSVWGRGAAFVESRRLRDRLLRFLVTRMYLLAFRLSAAVWFTNKSDYDFFARRSSGLAGKAFLTRNYVSAGEYAASTVPEERLRSLRRELSLDGSQRVVIMVARMIWAKGVRAFVEAARILKDTSPDLKLVLVGPPEAGMADAVPDSYLREGEKMGNFRWLGFREDVKDLYALSDLAVLPSYYREGGYPRGLTEAMAMSKPVIAADTEDCRGPVEPGKNGYLVPPHDGRALAKAIEAVVEDEPRRVAFGIYSRLKVERELDEAVIVPGVIAKFLAYLPERFRRQLRGSMVAPSGEQRVI